MGNAGLAWLIAGLALIAAIVLYLRSRNQDAARAQLVDDVERARAESEALRSQQHRNEDRKGKRGEELQELRRKLEKARKRAAQAKDELAPSHARIKDLEAQLLRRDDELRSLRSERVVAAPVVAAPVAPVVPAAPAVDEPALKASKERAEKAEARAAELAKAAAESAGVLERQKVRIRNQDTLYTSLRSELDVKNDQIKQQREELERLLALKVALFDAPDDEPRSDAAQQPVELSDFAEAPDAQSSALAESATPGAGGVSGSGG